MAAARASGRALHICRGYRDSEGDLKKHACWAYLVQQIVYVSWEQTCCACPLPTGHYSAIKGLRHMVIQIQFRYSQLTRLQRTELRIGQVDSLGHGKALQSLTANGWRPDLSIRISEPSLVPKQTRPFSCSAAARWPFTPAQPPAKLLRSYTRGPACHFHASSPSRSTGKTGCI